MKKRLLLSLSFSTLLLHSYAQNSLRIDAYHSGYVTPTNQAAAGDLEDLEVGGNRGFVTFDLNTVPNGTTITAITLTLGGGGVSFSDDTKNLEGSVTVLNKNTASVMPSYSEAGSGTVAGIISWDGSPGGKVVNLNAAGIAAVQKKCGTYMAFGINAPIDSNTYVYTFDGYENGGGISNKFPPFLTITYTAASAQAPVSDFYTSDRTPLENEEILFYENCGNSPDSWEWDFGDGTTAVGTNPSKIYTAAGIYTVKLKSTNSTGNHTEIKTNYITVYKPLIANFKADRTTVLLDDAIQFSDSTKNGPGQWLWKFGDGNTSTEQNPSYIYTGIGDYTVKLYVSHAAGTDSIVKENYIHIVEMIMAPEARFDYQTNNLQVNFSDSSLNGPETWLWDFDATANPGVNTSTLQNPNYTFPASGTYQVCLTVTNGGGSHTTCKFITVTEAGSIPDAAFSYIQDELEVTFSDESLNNPVSWLWDFDAIANPGVNTSTSQNPVYIFPAGGTYRVCLVATNSFGSNTICKDVTVSPAGNAPQADFSYTATDLDVTFSDESLNAPVSWLWDFDAIGNPGVNTSTAQHPMYTYPAAGTYQVCLTATNGFGSNTTCKNVVVSQSGNVPVADFSTQITAKTAAFTDLSANFPTSWSWDFGDAQTSALQHPNHTYASAGNYTVCLTATNAIGSDMTCKTITIIVAGLSSDEASFMIYPNPVTEGKLYVSSDHAVRQLSLYNTNGQELNVPVSIVDGSVTADLMNLPRGLYMLRITTEKGELLRQKLVIE